MITWPVAVVICFVIFAIYGLIDTRLKQPTFVKAVGDLKIKIRGKEAETAAAHFNSMTVMGFQDALDDAASDPSTPELKRGSKFERSTSAKR